MIYTKVSGANEHPIQLHEFLANVNVSQSGVIEGFEVTERSPQSLGVKVSLGRAFLIKADGSLAYPVLSDADVIDESVDVLPNGSGNPRIDTLILYYDEGAGAPEDDGSGVAKLKIVAGVPSATPSAPTNSDIITAMGGDYPYFERAYIYVASGVSVITNADITENIQYYIFNRPTLSKSSADNDDEIVLYDSLAGFIRKKLSFLNLKAVIGKVIYPVGSVYINANVSTNPATLLGFGTWTAWGVGKAIVGIDAGQTEFDTAEETGGSKTHTLTTAQLATHNHLGSAAAITGYEFKGTGGNSTWPFGGGTDSNQADLSNAGSGNSHNNLMPYQVGYVWKRVS